MSWDIDDYNLLKVRNTIERERNEILRENNQTLEKLYQELKYTNDILKEL